MSDSKTLDVKTRFCDRVTIRMDPETKKALKLFSKQSGVTECQLVHALLTGFFHGVQSQIGLDVKSPTINVSIERSVLRARRHVYTDVDDGANYYQGKDGLWLHMDGELNLNGHVVGCECLKCRKRGK